MIVIITPTYVVLVWLVYFRLRLLPFDLANEIGIALAGVVIVFGLSDEDMALLPGGAGGSAVIYAQALRPLGAIQKMAIRMEGYLNYLPGI